MSESTARSRRGRPAAVADVYVLPMGTPSGRAVLDRLWAAGHASPLTALASAFAASPPARSLPPDAVLTVREHPTPLFVFTGALDAAGAARIAELPALIEDAATRLRPFAWRDVESACDRLARRLVHQLQPDELAACAVVGIPRGGLVVAGLLAYALDLSRDQIGHDADAPVTLLVDDCILSGVRLRATLANTPAERIIVATLCSHPEMRRRVEVAEPRVAACVSGVDLHDHGPALLGEDQAAWRRLWTERVPERYHTALLDLVAFPWSEPEVRLWNPVTEQVEPHWWLAPTDVCVQHRSVPPPLAIQHADAHPAIGRLPPAVVPVTHAAGTDLIDPVRLRRVRLSGTAEELWQVWLSGDVRAAMAELAVRLRQPVARLCDDLEGLLRELRADGLLLPEAPSIEMQGART